MAANPTDALTQGLSIDVNQAPFYLSKPEAKATPPIEIPPVKTSQDVVQARMRLAPELGTAAADVKRAEMGMETDILAGRQAAAQQFAQQARETTDAYQKRLRDFPYPEFHPTQDNVQSLGALFSLVSTLGLMLGHSGKMASMNALKSMTGMMNGWRQGRADLFKNEVENFQKEFARMKAIRDDIKTDFDEYMKLLPYDRDAAALQAEVLARKMGANSVGTALLKQGRLTALDQYLDSQGKLIKEKEDKDSERKFRMQMLAYQRDTALAVADERAKARAQGALGGTAAAMERTLQQDVGNANYNLQEIMKLGKQEGEIPGGSFMFANRFGGDLTADIERYIYTQAVDPNPQTIDALLTNMSFDIASGLSGGRGQLSDSKIREVASQMPLQSQPEETRQARWKALLERVKNINASLPESRRVTIPQSVIEYFGGEDATAEPTVAPPGAALPKSTAPGQTLKFDIKGNLIG